jgi:hypothetical protein
VPSWFGPRQSGQFWADTGWMKSAISAATTAAVKGRGMGGDLAVVWRE